MSSRSSEKSLFVHDLRMLATVTTPFDPERHGTPHHALSDAKWLRDAHTEFKNRGLFG